MPYNVAANLRPTRPGSAYLDARDAANRNALAERQVTGQEQAQQFQQNRLVQADAAAAAQTARGNAQDDSKTAYLMLSTLDGAKADPAKFSALAGRIAQHPIMQKLGVTLEDLTPEGVAETLPVFAAQAGQAAPDRFEEVKGPRGSIIKKNVRTGDLAQVVGPDNTETPNYGQARAPAGYQFTPENTLVAIPGGPADPNTPSTRDDQRRFAKADKLRDEFNTQSKDFINVGDAYNTVQQLSKNPSAAGDLSMIFAFMKMLDPNSVVREQEFANAQNAAGVPERVANQYNKLLNGERLNPQQRQDFIGQAQNLFNTRKARQDSITKRYTEIAKRNGVNPDDVVGDLSVSVPSGAAAANAGPVRVNTPQEAAALPSGTQFVTPDGRVKVRP